MSVLTQSEAEAPSWQPEAQRALYSALSAAQGELATIPVPKNCTVRVRKKDGGTYTFRYADLPSIIDIVLPVAAKHGLCVVQSPSVTDDGRVEVRTVIYHAGGGCLHCGAIRSKHTGGPQDMGGAITYYRRYALCSVFCIAADDDDDANAASGNEATVTRDDTRARVRSALRKLDPEQAKAIVRDAGASSFAEATTEQLSAMASRVLVEAAK